MEAKEFFARIGSSNDMQAVINCDLLPEIDEVNKQEVRQAYNELSALQRCVVRKRMQRYHSAFSGKPEGVRQVEMLTQILQII